jgi:cytochrome P450 family 110
MRALPSSEVPGSHLPRLLQTLLGVMRPVEARHAARERYGGVFRSNDAIAGELFHIAERELVEQVFKWKPAQYSVGEPRQVMEPVTGPSSILLLDGEDHMRMRRLMLPPFHGEAIAHYAELIEQVTNREIDTWRQGDAIRTRAVAQRITMEVIIRAVFGITDPRRLAELQRVLPRLSSPNPLLLLVQKDLGPRSPWGRFLRVRDHVDGLLYEEIERRRADPDRDTGHDILTLLLSACDEAGDPLTDRELRRADHPPAGGARDDRHIDRLGVRATAAHPARARASDRRGPGR